MIATDAAGIFVHRHIQHMMPRVFDRPVLPYRLRHLSRATVIFLHGFMRTVRHPRPLPRVRLREEVPHFIVTASGSMALQTEDLVAARLDNLARQCARAAPGIHRDDLAFHLQPLQQGRPRADLVGLPLHLALPQRQAVGADQVPRGRGPGATLKLWRRVLPARAITAPGVAAGKAARQRTKRSPNACGFNRENTRRKVS